jgi:molybdopterin molybdotransferase
MIELKEALRIVLDSARPLGGERVGLDAALGRILAEDVAADMDLPPFDKATMDGYACRRADLDHVLTVIETIPAGTVPTRSVGPNQCAKIMTGAAVPQGADCVIMIEQTEQAAPDLGEGVPSLGREAIAVSPHSDTVKPGREEPGQEACAPGYEGARPAPRGPAAIRFTGGQTPDNIFRKGQDIKAGRAVLPKGSWIGPQHIAVLASVGCVKPLVAERPRVGIIASGSELVAPAARPAPSQIRNSNGPQLIAQLAALGMEARDYGVVKDVLADLVPVLQRALGENDVVLLSGGASVGDFDLAPPAMQRNGVRLLFEKIAVKPGKPTIFGVADGAYCFGLPGNPVSTFVVFELLVKPFLYQLMGHVYAPVTVQMEVEEEIVRKDTERQGWFPVRRTGATKVRPVDYHGSAHLAALAQADGLVCLDIGMARIAQGAPARVRLLGSIG